ncbi:MAG: NAD(P)H-dependent oxidoreductase [Thiohalobacterales bacterium]|nr:NAD(P)H-dependent oxidoreductase [Thiohalobacterales bacterium]
MTKTPITRLLRIDSSASMTESITRRLGDVVEERLARENPGLAVTRRDLANGIEFIDQAWVEANLTDPEMRTTAQQARLAGSDTLIAELRDADAVLITVPLYNFSIPSTLKAWIDQVCRARLTFRYAADGPVGLLADRPVYLVMASGGVGFGSAMDFASTYLAHVLGFIGIRDIRPIHAERTAVDPTASEHAARRMLEQWLPASHAA